MHKKTIIRVVKLASSLSFKWFQYITLLYDVYTTFVYSLGQSTPQMEDNDSSNLVPKIFHVTISRKLSELPTPPTPDFLTDF